LDESGLVGWTARSRTSSLIGACAASPVSRSDGVAVAGIEAMGAAMTMGFGIAGVTGSTQVVASEGATAITSGGGISKGATGPGESAPPAGGFAAGAPGAEFVA